MRVNYICRLCLHPSLTKLTLLNTKAADMLEALTDIKVEPTDEILTMCLKCSLNLKLAYSIQQKFLMCEEQIRKGLVKKENENETEICTEETTICEDIIKIEAPCIVCGEVMDEISHSKHCDDKQFCDLCNQNFCDKKSCRTYLLDHSEHSPHKCEKCDKTFLSKSLHDIHIKSSHLEKIPASPPTEKKERPRVPGPPFKCDICSKHFSTREKLAHHKYGHKRKECPICKKSVVSYHYGAHVQNHHSGPQTCEHCGKTFPDNSTLNNHIVYHHRSIKFECKECNRTFKGRNGLVYHNKCHHGKGIGHVCQICGKKFCTGYILKKHISNFHYKARPYSCEFCKKSFSRQSTLKLHRRQHTNELPFKCEECGKGFKQNVSLRSHRKSKHNIIEAVTCCCVKCGKGFSSRLALNAHMRVH